MSKFKATHLLEYDRGVWIRVMKEGLDYVTKEGWKFRPYNSAGVKELKKPKSRK